MIDGLLIHKITNNLKEKLLSGKIQKIYQINNNELLLKIRSNRKNYQLLNSIQSNSFRLHLTNKQYSTLKEATNLSMSLRKHLEGGVINNIYQNECDRTIIFEIIKFNELRDEQIRYLIFELVGRHSNTILCDQDYKIIDTLKNIPLSQGLKRIIHRGATYEFIDLNNKINPLTGIEDSLDYLKKYQGFSKQLNQEFVYQNKHGINASQLLENYLNSNTIYCYKNIVSFLKLETKIEKPLIFTDIDEAFDSIFHQESENESIKYSFKNEVKTIKALIKKNSKKIIKLEVQYQNNLEYDIYRKQGSLLYDNIYLFDKNKHYNNVSIFDYETNEELVVQLDEKINYAQNAKKYLQKYNKMKKSFAYLSEQIKKAHEQNEFLQAILDNLDYAKVNDAKEIMEDLHNKNIIRSYSNSKKRKANYKPKYETYISSDGTSILVGKNSLQNEYITFNEANRNDVWFHVKDLAGAHVVVLSENPSNQTIEEAAKLALVYSKAVQNIDYDVDYTQVKNLRKVKGSKLGQVSFNTSKTIKVVNDINILNQLKRGN